MPPSSPEQTVYSYYMPEVREVVRRILKDGADGLNELLRQNVDPGLDGIEDPLLDKFERHGRENGVIGWNDLPNRYYVNGSSEALFHLIAQHVGSEKSLPLYQLEGEYQGYEAYAKALGMRVETVTERQLRSDWSDASRGVRPMLRSGLFLLSNPSARDGNLLDRTLWRAIVEQHEVILDLAYLGMTDPMELDLSHPNIRAVTASMSKPFGLYYFRSGFCWSRNPIDSLHGNRWFKNVQSIRVAEAVLDWIPARLIRAKYRVLQGDTIRDLNRELGIARSSPAEIKRSDVWLLAHAGPSEFPAHEPYRRAGGYRFCLTPYYMEAESA